MHGREAEEDEEYRQKEEYVWMSCYKNKSREVNN